MRIKHHKRSTNISKLSLIYTCVVILFITVGYSSFNTNIKLIAKGNIYNKSELCYTTSDNGDGTLSITDYNASCGSEVVIPKTIRGKKVTRIEDTNWNVYKSFNNKGLTKVALSDNIVYIGSCSFRNNSIKELDLGNTVTTIEWEAFAINKLTSINFPVSLKQIGPGAFQENSLYTLPSLENITSLGKGAFTGNSISDNNKFVYSKYGDSFDYTALNSYAGDWVTELNLPSNIKTLMYYSMRHTRATTVNINEGIESIEDAAFMQSYATTVNIPSTIKNIGNGAFAQSTAVKTINIDRKKDSIEGAPWGAINATVNWTGNN